MSNVSNLAWMTCLAFIVLLRGVITICLSVHLPLWEYVDELNHTLYVEFIAQNHRLPVKDDYPILPDELKSLVQFDQPPLFYMMSAGLWQLFGVDEQSARPTPISPSVCAAMELVGYFEHPEVMRQIPGEGLVRGAWVGRGLNITIGLVTTIVLAYAVRRSSPEDPALSLWAALLFALAPYTLNVSIWVNNDALLMLWGAIFLWIVNTAQAVFSLRHAVLLCVVAGLCLLTKLNGLAICPPLLVLLWFRMRQSKRLQLLSLSLAAGLFILFIGSSIARCGQPLCRLHRSTPMFDSVERFIYFLRRPDYRGNYEHLLSSAFAPTVHEGTETTGFVFAQVGLVLVTLAVAAVSRPTLRTGLKIGVCLLVSAWGLAHLRVWWFPYAVYMPARYLALAFPAWSWLLAFAARSRWWIPGSLVVLWFGLAVLWPQIDYQRIVQRDARVDRLPDTAIAAPTYQWHNGLALVGYEVIQLEQKTRIRIYLESHASSKNPYYLSLSLYDRNGSQLMVCSRSTSRAGDSLAEWPLDGQLVALDFDFPAIAAESMMLHMYEIDVINYLQAVPKTVTIPPKSPQAPLPLRF